MNQKAKEALHYYIKIKAISSSFKEQLDELEEEALDDVERTLDQEEEDEEEAPPHCGRCCR